MATIIDNEILEEMLDPVGQCLTREVATRIAGLRADQRLQNRLDELAEKNAEKVLTATEDAEYAAYVEALDVMAIFQAVARKTLKPAGRSR
jgi:hypothetical protein